MEVFIRELKLVVVAVAECDNEHLTISLKDAADESSTHFLFVYVPKICLQTLVLLEG